MKRVPAQSAFFDTSEEIFICSLAFYLSQRLPDQIDRKVEDDLEKSFLTAEVLEKRTFCNTYALHHAVDARLSKPVLGELVDGSIQDLVFLGFIKVIEPVAWKHTLFSGENDQVVIISMGGMLSNRKRGMREKEGQGRAGTGFISPARWATLYWIRHGIFDRTG